MQLHHKLAPLLNAAVGAFALMIPTPTPGSSVAELSPLPPIAIYAAVETPVEDPAIATLRQQAGAALASLQAASTTLR